MLPRKHLSISKQAISSQLKYLKPFLISRGFMVLILLILYSLYSGLYKGGGRFGGFTLLTLFYYLAVTNALGTSGANVFSEISDEIKEGTCAYSLLRPVHYLTYKYFNNIGPALVNFSVSLAAGILTFGLLAGFDLRLIRGILLAFPLFFLSLSLFFSVSLIIGLLAFFIEETVPVNWIYGKVQFLLGGAFIPLDLFPEWLRSAAQYLPTAFIVYYPAKCAVAFEPVFYLKILAGQLGYLAVLLYFASLLFRKGMREVQINGG